MNKRTLYTDEPNTRKATAVETIGMIFAVTMLLVVLPIAIFILTMYA